MNNDESVNENVIQGPWKKNLQKDGFYTELRNREHYRSRSEKRRLAKAAGRRRHLKTRQKRMEELGY